MPTNRRQTPKIYLNESRWFPKFFLEICHLATFTSSLCLNTTAELCYILISKMDKNGIRKEGTWTYCLPQPNKQSPSAASRALCCSPMRDGNAAADDDDGVTIQMFAMQRARTSQTAVLSLTTDLRSTSVIFFTNKFRYIFLSIHFTSLYTATQLWLPRVFFCQPFVVVMLCTVSVYRVYGCSLHSVRTCSY